MAKNTQHTSRSWDKPSGSNIWHIHKQRVCSEQLTLYSMKVDDIRAAGAGGKLDTDALKQSDLYLGND